MPLLSKLITWEILASAAAVGVVTTIAICWYHKKKNQNPPKVWERVGVVKHLYIYPFKSGKAIELDTALCTNVGVKMPDVENRHQLRDRSFVVYNEDDNKFQTARTIPKLVLIKISAVDQDHVTLTAPNMPILVIKIPNATENKKVTVTQHFDEKITILDCGDAVAKWISMYASEGSKDLRIGYNDGKRRRNLNPTHKKYFKLYPRLSNEATGLQSDFSSYLLLNEASVKDLQEKSPEGNISHLNFRPNILIEGAPAFAEEDWEWIKIGDVILYSVKWCTRCLLTTVNPNTGVMSEISEPIKTLRTYRLLKDVKKISLDGNSPVMGVNLGYHSGEKINIGDAVYVGK